jgi:dihydrofolate reductase
MIISQIVAYSNDFAIGKEQKLLWHLPLDMAWFKDKTITNPVIMGRNTMAALKKPLPNRRNIVLSSNPNLILPGFEWARSVEQAVEMAKNTAKEEIFIIGGGQLYKGSIELCEKLYITKVDASFPQADTHYPDIDLSKWKETFSEDHMQDEKHKYSFSFHIYERKLEEDKKA